MKLKKYNKTTAAILTTAIMSTATSLLDLNTSTLPIEQILTTAVSAFFVWLVPNKN